tara:strand:- start:74253 stop:74588 length:336 start_codon:yes stop_codon:yes gene_type:complete
MIILFLKITLMLVVGSLFFRMAIQYNSKPWSIFILGAASFYAGLIIFDNSIDLIKLFNSNWELNNNLLQMGSFIFALVASSVCYSILAEQLKLTMIKKSSKMVRKFAKHSD